MAMLLPSPPTLLDVSGFRLSYLLWTRRLVTVHNRSVDDFFNQNEIAALAALEGLALQEDLHTLLISYLKPTGGRLFSLLTLWLSKLPLDTPQKWSVGSMLFDCLVLDGNGLIDHRRTAQTLIRNKILHNALAFRLACINFLETEVLNLWALAKDYFLNKIVREGIRPNEFPSVFSGAGPIPEDDLEAFYTEITEPDEVLFWIAYCLSREKAVDIAEVPHFMGLENDWYEFAFDSAVSSGNVACFGYLINFRDEPFEYVYAGSIRRILTEGRKCQHSSFTFHFMLLNPQEKSELLRELPRETVRQLLQWPLSQTFLRNTQEVWNLLPEINKHLVLLEVFNILMFENVIFCRDLIRNTIHNFLTYRVEDVSEIWKALWKISSNDCKSAFLDLRIFPGFEDLDDDEFPSRFVTSGLKQKLLGLCLSNSRAVLELYQKDTLQKSLRSVVAKYMPEDLQDLERTFLSFFETPIIPLISFIKNRGNLWRRGIMVNGIFLNYIQTVLSSDGI